MQASQILLQQHEEKKHFFTDTLNQERDKVGMIVCTSVLGGSRYLQMLEASCFHLFTVFVLS